MCYFLVTCRSKNQKPKGICECGALQSVTHTEFNNLIQIDIQPHDYVSTVKLSAIPLKLKIFRISFTFVGCIEYIPGIDSVGHYICHARRINEQWETYNDLKSNISTPNINIDINIVHMIFFATART